MQFTFRVTLLSAGAVLLALAGAPATAWANYAEGPAQSPEPAPEAVQAGIAAENPVDLDEPDLDPIIDKMQEDILDDLDD